MINKKDSDKASVLAGEPLGLEELYSRLELPDEWAEDNLLVKIQRELELFNGWIFVLDDDPTGTQTVHNVMVITSWSDEDLRAAFSKSKTLSRRVIYISTNSRSYGADQAEKISYEICRRIERLSESEEFHPIIISRSDSTLRGHLVAETTALQRASSAAYDGIIFAPFFEEGGRITVGVDEKIIHWVIQSEKGRQVAYPAVLTDYARDTDFGFDSLFLSDYLVEKHTKAGRVLKKEDILVIAIEELRNGGYDCVTQRLSDVKGGKYVIVSAVTYRDMEVFSLGLLNSMRYHHKRFLIRSAASIVRTLGGIEPRELLTAESIYPQGRSEGNGLIVVGSYVNLTQLQFEHTSRALPDLVKVELDVKKVLSPDLRIQVEQDTIKTINEAFDNKKDVLFFTSRQRVSSEKGQSLVGRTVSDSVISIIQQLKNKPGWVVAKGGITSYDVAKKGLKMRQAVIKGQIRKGIPVWAIESGSVLTIVPGNVGKEETLTEIIQELRKR